MHAPTHRASRHRWQNPLKLSPFRQQWIVDYDSGGTCVSLKLLVGGFDGTSVNKIFISCVTSTLGAATSNQKASNWARSANPTRILKSQVCVCTTQISQLGMSCESFRGIFYSILSGKKSKILPCLLTLIHIISKIENTYFHSHSYVLNKIVPKLLQIINIT